MHAFEEPSDDTALGPQRCGHNLFVGSSTPSRWDRHLCEGLAGSSEIRSGPSAADGTPLGLGPGGVPSANMVAVIVIGISACTQATAGTGARSASATATSSSSSHAAGSKVPSPAQFDSVVLRDLPAGWDDQNGGDSAGPGVDIDSGAEPTDIQVCSGLATIEHSRIDEGDSDDFDGGDSGSVVERGELFIR